MQRAVLGDLAARPRTTSRSTTGFNPLLLFPSPSLAIHNWFDESKSFFTDFRHRALRHHAEGIFLAERIFGVTIVNSDGEQVPVRYVGEQHVKEDLGRIPTAQDWLSQIKPERWMYGQRLAQDDSELHS